MPWGTVLQHHNASRSVHNPDLLLCQTFEIPPVALCSDWAVAARDVSIVVVDHVLDLGAGLAGPSPILVCQSLPLLAWKARYSQSLPQRRNVRHGAHGEEINPDRSLPDSAPLQPGRLQRGLNSVVAGRHLEVHLGLEAVEDGTSLGRVRTHQHRDQQREGRVVGALHPLPKPVHHRQREVQHRLPRHVARRDSLDVQVQRIGAR
mmetsp:Transcript_58303/g.87896  ORF Transcript_58303/g.87896 Transcript_58303/m.87896 type:complete len:205 (+) Transcript_58303:307-921(+)